MTQENKKNNLKRGLGRGLSSLIPDDIEESIIFDDGKREERIQEIEIDKIKANALQPRRTFDPEELESLCTSIKRNGVIQPIVLRRMGENYEIIAGERRWRASMQAKLKKIPAVIMDLDEEQRYEVSLVENLQRSDLNPIEEAMAYKTLLEKYNMTQEKISEIVGKSRTYVTNMTRLLKLAKSVQEDLINNKITVGHAKMLVTLSDRKQMELSKKIQESQMNVRDLENLLKPKPEKKEKHVNEESEYYELSEELSEQYGTKVEILKGKNKGKIVLEFYGEEDFERLYQLIRK
ncbi:MAG: ParB/RepB/Spo0J family partition protein [Bacillota bacterium]|nr:ParB/RepB/Spo0J family partition protein [Bacillota bacterium]